MTILLLSINLWGALLTQVQVGTGQLSLGPLPQLATQYLHPVLLSAPALSIA
jgi:hypothetical protein